MKFMCVIKTYDNRSDKQATAAAAENDTFERESKRKRNTLYTNEMEEKMKGGN